MHALRKQRFLHALQPLQLADPSLADQIADGLCACAHDPAPGRLDELVEKVLWGLSQELGFGRMLAAELAQLAGHLTDSHWAHYCQKVQQAGDHGPALGALMATHLSVVMQHGDSDLADEFHQAVEMMRQKGDYTLKRPLEAVSRLLKETDMVSAREALKVFAAAFSMPLNYNESLRLTRLLPRAVTEFAADRRAFQLVALQRVIRVDASLAEPFIEGLGADLGYLSEPGLKRFVDLALARCRKNISDAGRFLALQHQLAREHCQRLQVAVAMVSMAPVLNRYLRARLDRAISVAAFPSAAGPACVTTNGRHIFVPTEINRYPRRFQNERLYKILVRLEAAAIEFGSYDFDLQRTCQRCVQSGLALPALSKTVDGDMDELQVFFSMFSNRLLAWDLFTCFEHGRLQQCMTRRYPGIGRQAQPLLDDEMNRLNDPPGDNWVAALYRCVVLQQPLPFEDPSGLLAPMVSIFQMLQQPGATVETSALATAMAMAHWEQAGTPACDGPLKTPFDRRLRPDLFLQAHRSTDRQARQLRDALASKGLKVYRADLFKCLQAGDLPPDPAQLAALAHGAGEKPSADFISLSQEALAQVFGRRRYTTAAMAEPSGAVFWYPEWDARLGDYLADHVRVAEKSARGDDDQFYSATLDRRAGLLMRMRRAFELLRPEGLRILRPWSEGDAFDYRALIDYAIDHHMGRMPSQRLYIKRVKQMRDVAVLLLVDLSRSTAHPVSDSRQCVLDVEKEAIVLLCEALDVVGDRFAVAGFSGSGRLGLVYQWVKRFEQPLDPLVRQRIGALSPLRSTRMGGAIRHARHHLQQVAARSRLLLVLSDGFPNDIDYKRSYAAEDTRRALLEAHACGLYMHAITVNAGSPAHLDAVYGRNNHSVIADVRDLPDRLLRMYSRLTRS